MINFARVMGLIFGSAGAHTYPNSRQFSRPIQILSAPVPGMNNDQSRNKLTLPDLSLLLPTPLSNRGGGGFSGPTNS